MLEFDAKGFLKPYTSVTSNVEELRQVFVEEMESEKRKEHFEKYVNYTDELKRALNIKAVKQWIDGSFISKRVNPSDIDIISFIDHDIVKKHEKELNDFGRKNSFSKFGVDAYILEVFPEGHKDRFRTEYDIKEWYNWYTKTKKNRRGNKYPKGFIEIIY